MVMVQISEDISNKFNIERNCTEVISKLYDSTFMSSSWKTFYFLVT